MNGGLRVDERPGARSDLALDLLLEAYLKQGVTTYGPAAAADRTRSPGGENAPVGGHPTRGGRPYRGPYTASSTATIMSHVTDDT